MLPTPNPKFLFVGKGSLYFALQISDNVFGPFEHFGNVRELTPSLTDDKQDVLSSMEPNAPVYDTWGRSRKMEIRALFEEFARKHVQKLMMGTLATVGAQAATPVVAESLYPNVPAATLGAALGGAVLFGAKFGPHTAIVVDLGATELVLGTDYDIVQNSRGLLGIRILPGSTQVTDGILDLTVDYTPTAYTATDMATIAIGELQEIKGKIHFEGKPTKGPTMIVDIPLVSINPTGNLPLITEDIAQGELVMTVLDDSINNPTAPMGTVRYIDPQ